MSRPGQNPLDVSVRLHWKLQVPRSHHLLSCWVSSMGWLRWWQVSHLGVDRLSLGVWIQLVAVWPFITGSPFELETVTWPVGRWTWQFHWGSLSLGAGQDPSWGRHLVCDIHSLLFLRDLPCFPGQSPEASASLYSQKKSQDYYHMLL